MSVVRTLKWKRDLRVAIQSASREEGGDRIGPRPFCRNRSVDVRTLWTAQDRKRTIDVVCRSECGKSWVIETDGYPLPREFARFKGDPPSCHHLLEWRFDEWNSVGHAPGSMHGVEIYFYDRSTLYGKGAIVGFPIGRVQFAYAACVAWIERGERAA